VCRVQCWASQPRQPNVPKAKQQPSVLGFGRAMSDATLEALRKLRFCQNAMNTFIAVNGLRDAKIGRD
jgi:hypothetical protein